MASGVAGKFNRYRFALGILNADRPVLDVGQRAANMRLCKKAGAAKNTRVAMAAIGSSGVREIGI